MNFNYDGTLLHRPERKMRQNAVMTCIFYNYVSRPEKVHLYHWKEMID